MPFGDAGGGSYDNTTASGDIGSGFGSGSADTSQTDTGSVYPTTPYAAQATGAGLTANYGGGAQPGNTGAGTYPVATGPGSAAPPATSAPNWGSLLSAFQPDPAWAQQSQQYLNWYTGTEYPQQYALQQQLQNSQIGLAQNQNDMQNALATAGLTGYYGGDPTLQAQSLMAQYGLAGSDQALAARGQDVSMAGIQAQLAQSPLVAWYTARGLPPPQSALMQALPNFNPYQENWQFSGQGPPVQSLTPTPTANLVTMPTNMQDVYNTSLAGYGQVRAAGIPWNEQSYEGVMQQQGIPKTIADQMWQQAQVFSGQTGGKTMDPTTWGGQLTTDINQYNTDQGYNAAFQGGSIGGGWSPWGGGSTPQMGSNVAQAWSPTAATDPSMSQGAPPWATTMAGGGQANPLFVGSMQGMPSTQEWASANPQEQQAMMSVAQSINGFDPTTFYQQLNAQAPNFGGSAAPASYQSY